MDHRDRQKMTPLISTACGYDETYAAFLLDNGADVNSADRNGKSVLMYAAEAVNPQIVRHLLESGARVNDRDQGGKTALQCFREKYGKSKYANGEKTLKLLLDAGGAE
ncbi:MAG: ankyrin repeat domain-containing protein [Candidatus Wallbacteria bacterium]|nr:ankyrin repeat domain-containing protein [Candidatus Wallbacteria bacterium]